MTCDSTPSTHHDLRCDLQSQTDGAPEPPINTNPPSSAPDPIPTKHATGPLPTLPPTPQRALQIPTRSTFITWGFPFPPNLQKTGITKRDWRAFTAELSDLCRLSFSQWSAVLGGGWGMAMLVNTVAGGFTGYKMYKHRNMCNFEIAHGDGVVGELVARWNREYFEARGWHVVVEAPGVSTVFVSGGGGGGGAAAAAQWDIHVPRMELFRSQQQKKEKEKRLGSGGHAGRKEARYRGKEGRRRAKAAGKARIVVWPIELVPMEARATVRLQLQLPASGQSCQGQGQVSGVVEGEAPPYVAEAGKV